MKQIANKKNLINKYLYIMVKTTEAFIHYVGKIDSQEKTIVTSENGNMFVMFKNKDRRCYHYKQPFELDIDDNYNVFELSENEFVDTYLNFIRNDKKLKKDININLIANY